MLIDRFIGCLFLCLCALLWFVIIPQQISGEDQAMYPRLTIIFLAIPALFMALRTTGKNISLEAVAKAFSNPSDSVFPRILFLIVSYAVCIMSTEYVGFFVTNAVFGMIYIFFFLERGLIRIVLTPLLLLGVIYGIVVFFLNYPLPSGILF